LNKIKKMIQKAIKVFHFEIKLIENSENSGAFINKYRLIKASSNDWVYQIDSDNIPFSNIDNVIAQIADSHESQLFIYYPTKLIQFWRYRKVAEILSKIQKKYIVRFSKEVKIFDIYKTQKAINEFLSYDTSNDTTEGSPELQSKYVLDKHIYWVLNCGNFVVNKNQFLSTMEHGLDYPREILSMDAVAFSYLWLKSNGKIVLQPGLSHYHRKRLTSISYIEKESSKISREYFTDKILSL